MKSSCGKMGEQKKIFLGNPILFEDLMSKEEKVYFISYIGRYVSIYLMDHIGMRL